ncbi:hypothetical protein FA95DRAFT_1478960, partial [Auriscalpium vulgare]
DLISQALTPYNHYSEIVSPFDAESKRDEAFRAKFKDLMLEIIAETQAWAEARPKFENEQASNALAQEMDAINEMERDQGRSSESLPHAPSPSMRRGLVEFVTNVRNALLRLSG